MKKAIIISLFALGGASAVEAQSLPVQRDTTVTVSTDRYKVVTNRFADNWFLGVGAGANVYFGDHDKQMKFADRIAAPVISVQLGKWFTPGIGVRANFTHGTVKGVTQELGKFSTGEIYNDTDYRPLVKEKFDYRHYHADALFNLSNLFGGYKEDRFYELNFYGGIGWMVNTSDATNGAPLEKKLRDVSANVGIENVFRLSRSLDLALDIRGAMVDDRFDGEDGTDRVNNERQEGPLSAILALKYNFKKRNWDKPTVTVIESNYDEALLNELRDRVAKLAADNDALKRQLADAKGEVITDIQFKDRILAAPILVTFKIDTWDVRNEARVNLGFFAETIKRGSPDVVYTITGYADKGTGSVARNELLSRNRAAAIKKVLVEEFGVDPARLRTEHKGGVENMYYDDPRVSRAVIVIGE